MGISEDFIRWVKFIFGNASTTVNLNGAPSGSFKVERGIRQGCPPRPIFFSHRGRGSYTINY
jgi:hypothetical protein